MASSDSTRSSTEIPLVAVGVVTGAHGIRGQVKIKSFTTNAHDLTSYGPLMNKEGTRRYELQIDANSKNGLIASIKGVNDRNAAELMRGTEFFAAKEKLPKASAEEFYYEELVGLKALSRTGEPVGEITAVYNFGASDVVEMRLVSTGKKELYPFTNAIFPEVHVSKGSCVVELPEIVEAPPKSKEDE